MSDTTYQILQDGQTYKVRITRLGEFLSIIDARRGQSRRVLRSAARA